MIDHPSDPGSGFTQIESNEKAHLDGEIRICLSDLTRGAKSGARIPLVTYKGFSGRFSSVKFVCDEDKHRSSAKYARVRAEKLAAAQAQLLPWDDIADWARGLVGMEMAVEASCEPSTDYSGTNFAVLLEGDGCGSGGGSAGTGYDIHDPIVWLSLSFAVVGICCCVTVGVIYVAVPPFRRVVAGKESERIRQVRSTRRSFVNSSSKGTDTNIFSQREDMAFPEEEEEALPAKQLASPRAGKIQLSEL
mmetsp:Transcript_9220/g.37943  ORF Transcript_9220/g.37943 Transcript_9220/m.37943 type:complete len:248 (-) Transcript_9220:36-779(-)